MPSSLARSLRRNPTEAERQLWCRLRGRQLEGHKFRRQVPIGPYIADFACLSESLVLEINGGQHTWNADKDATRTAWLEANGFRVLRFWNNEVLGNIERVLEAIRRNLPPIPTLPHKGG